MGPSKRIEKSIKPRIDGPFYPWLAEMGKSAAMQKLRKNSEAVNVLTMFITKYSLANKGENLCVTYKEASKYLSASTYAKAKLWCMAFGFLHCTQFGRLEHNPSIYELSTKWKYLSNKLDKLDYIEQLLERREKIARTTTREIPEETWRKPCGELVFESARSWRSAEMRKIEIEILKQ